MAYKFQLGAATMSGSLTQEGDVEVKDGGLTIPNSSTIGCAADDDLITLASTSVAFANDVDVNVAKAGGLQIGGSAVTSTATEINLLDAITRGSIIYGNSSGVSARLAAGSANTVLSTDGTDIGYSQVDNAMIDSSAGIQLSKLESVSSGRIIVGNGSNVPTAVAVSGDATLSNGGALTLAAAQTNITSLLATDIKIGEDDQTKIDFETADEIHFYAANAEQVYVADGIFGPQTDSDVDLGSTGVRWKDAFMDSITVTDNLTIGGNLTVNGTTTTVNSTTINITSSLTFEGPADAHETVFGITDPTADATINLPAMSAGTYHVPVLAAVSTTAITATPAEINLIDGGTARGTTAVASGDGFLHNDGGTMRMTSVDKMADFFAGGSGLTASSGVISVDIDGLSALGGTGLHQTQDHFMFSDNGTEKKITFSNLEDAIFGNVSGDATIAAGGALTIANDAVEQAMIADDAVGADQLAANAVVNASIASNAAIDMDKLDGGSLASSLSDLDQGDLLYAGDVDDSNNIKSITFSNLEDAIFGNVSGDIALAAGGAATIQANAVEGSMLNNNIVSGLTDIGAAIVGTDEMIISDNGTIRRTDMSRLKTFIGSGTSAITEHGDANRTLAVGVNVATANTSTARTWTLPESSGLTVGESVKIKVAGVSSGAITIARDGSQTIDGSLTSIVLESDNAAVELIYVGADDWRLF